MSRKMSQNGLAIVKAFESCLHPVKGKPGYFQTYRDSGGVLTIGWGHTNHHTPAFDSSSVWSQQQCDTALANDITIFEDHVTQLAKVPLTQNEFDALVSWSYNTGGPATATLWRKLNTGNKSAVPAELAKWNKDNGETLRGLTRRRLSEGQLFVGDLAAAFKTANTTPPKPTQEPVQTVPEVKATPVAPKPETPQEAPEVAQATPEGPSVASTVWTWLKDH